MQPRTTPRRLVRACLLAACALTVLAFVLPAAPATGAATTNTSSSSATGTAAPGNATADAPTEHHGLLQRIADWSMAFMRSYGLFGIFILMLLETGMIVHGVPSELIMTFGTIAVADTPAEVLVVVAVGTVAAGLGAMIPYWAALYGGRPFILRHKAFFHMTEARLDRLDRLFQRPAGAWLVFVCRLLPFFRAFVSIPAGLARMNLALFAILSTAGALVFNFVLAYGAYLTRYEPTSTPARAYLHVEDYVAHHWIPITVVALALAITVFIGWRKRRRVATEYTRLMPQGWAGTVIAAALVLLLLLALFVLAPATFNGFVARSQGELSEVGRAEQGSPWVRPLLSLLGVLVLVFFLAAVRHQVANVLRRAAGKPVRKDPGPHRLREEPDGRDPPPPPP